MSEEHRSTSRTLQTVAFVAVPVIVAILVAVVVLSARSDDGGDDESTGRRDDAPAVAFCEQTASIRGQIEAAVARLEDSGTDAPTPAEIADLVESFDIASLDVDSAPAELRDDLRYLLEHRDEALVKIRSAPADTPVTEIVPADLAERFSTLVQFSISNCVADG